jgi:hypothetical protein
MIARMRFHPFTLVSLCAASALAQTSHPVGFRDLAFPNPTGQGSASLAARVHYPATAAGAGTPVLARPGGWPTVVFLHGFAALGSFYTTLGDELAANGFVAVLGDTAQFSAPTQALDGVALWHALGIATRTPGHPLEGAIDTARIGLAGHSMGGGNVGNVLAQNPGYRCGVAFAPVTPAAGNAARVAVPLVIVVGAGDTTTPWQTWSLPFYQDLSAYRSLKALYLLNNDCNHLNVAGLFLSGTTAIEVWQRSVGTALGCFRRYLTNDATGLEAVVGLSARGEPRLVSLSVEVADAEPWAAAPIRIGATTRLSVAAEPGPAALLAAAGPGSLPTPIGLLTLDPASVFVAWSGLAGAERRFDAALTLPADPRLIGVAVPVQALGAVRSAPVWLGNATTLRVVP